MKIMRSLAALVGLPLLLLLGAATGAKAQVLTMPAFSGTFTLPFEAEWGGMTLPAGDYTLHYGAVGGGPRIVEIAGQAKGSPHGLVQIESRGRSLAPNNALICTRTGRKGIVRTLELPAIQTALNFGLPRGVELQAREPDREAYPQTAGGPMLVQRVPVMPTKK